MATSQPSEIVAEPERAARQIATAVELNAVWRRNREDLLKALKRAGGTHEEGDVLAGILAGRLHLWAGRNAAVVTELVQYPRLIALRFFLAGGDLEDLKAMEREIAWRARASGIARIEIGGRPGWERALSGYRRLCITLVKELGGRPSGNPDGAPAVPDGPGPAAPGQTSEKRTRA